MTTPASPDMRDAARRAPMGRFLPLVMALLFLPGLAQAALTPFHCVDLNYPEAPAGAIAVRIGYINDSLETVTVPFGPDNFFSPTPAFRGQITEFLPGVHERAFTTQVETDGQIVSYVLNGVRRELTFEIEDFCSGGVSDLIVTTSGAIFASTAEAGVYRSTDGGTSWQAVNAGLDDLHVHTLEIHPSDPSTLFAGTDTGVYKSSDGGETWQAFNNGFPGANAVP